MVDSIEEIPADAENFEASEAKKPTNLIKAPKKSNGKYTNGKSTFADDQGASAAPRNVAPNAASTKSTFENTPMSDTSSSAEYSTPPVPDASDERVTLFLTPETANGDTISKLWHLCKKHRGTTEVWLSIDTGTRAAQMRVSPTYWVEPNDEFVQAAVELLGQDKVRLPVENGVSTTT